MRRREMEKRRLRKIYKLIHRHEKEGMGVLINEPK